MKNSFVERIEALGIPAGRNDIKVLENALKTDFGLDEQALDLSIRVLEARNGPFVKFSSSSLIRSYKDKLIASSTDYCSLCNSSGWLLAVTLDDNQNRWLVDYSNPAKAFNYCAKILKAQSDVISVPCICSNGDRHNHKHEKEWVTRTVRKKAADYTPKGLDVIETNSLLRQLSDALNSRNENYEIVNA